jgi:hypothetical protein
LVSKKVDFGGCFKNKSYLCEASLLEGKNKLQKETIALIAEKNTYQLPCLAEKFLVFFDELGNVFACELFKDSISNLKNQNFREIWFG